MSKEQQALKNIVDHAINNVNIRYKHFEAGNDVEILQNLIFKAEELEKKNKELEEALDIACLELQEYWECEKYEHCKTHDCDTCVKNRILNGQW